MTGFLWSLLGAGFLLASLPFLGKRTFLGFPVFKVEKKPFVYTLEFFVAYALFVLLGRVFEGVVSQVASQGWAFYAVTFLLFIVAAAPAFIWRYLWQK